MTDHPASAKVIKQEDESSDEDSDEERRYSGPPREPLMMIGQNRDTGSIQVIEFPPRTKLEDQVAQASGVGGGNITGRTQLKLGARDDAGPSARKTRSETLYTRTPPAGGDGKEHSLLHYLCCGCCCNSNGDTDEEVLILNTPRGKRDRKIEVVTMDSAESSRSDSLPYDGSYRPPIMELHPEIPDAKPIYIPKSN